MSTYEDEHQKENNLSYYKQLKETGPRLVSQLTVWKNVYDQLHANSSAENKLVLEAKNDDMVNQIKTIFGI